MNDAGNFQKKTLYDNSTTERRTARISSLLSKVLGQERTEGAASGGRGADSLDPLSFVSRVNFSSDTVCRLNHFRWESYGESVS